MRVCECGMRVGERGAAGCPGCRVPRFRLGCRLRLRSSADECSSSRGDEAQQRWPPMSALMAACLTALVATTTCVAFALASLALAPDATSFASAPVAQPVLCGALAYVFAENSFKLKLGGARQQWPQPASGPPTCAQCAVAVAPWPSAASPGSPAPLTRTKATTYRAPDLSNLSGT